MSRKPSCVNLDRDLILIVQGYPLQIDNISDILNKFLLALASEGEELTPSQIREKVWNIAQQKRSELIEKQKQANEQGKVAKLPDPKIRCWDVADEVFRLVPMSEIKAFPERFELDEKIGGIV